MRNVPTVWIVCLCISSLSRMMCPVERFHQTTRVPIKCSSLHQFFGFFFSLTCHFLSSFTHNAPHCTVSCIQDSRAFDYFVKPKAQMCDELSVKSILGIDTKSTFEFIEALDISSIARHVIFACHWMKFSAAINQPLLLLLSLLEMTFFCYFAALHK